MRRLTPHPAAARAAWRIVQAAIVSVVLAASLLSAHQPAGVAEVPIGTCAPCKAVYPDWWCNLWFDCDQ